MQSLFVFLLLAAVLACAVAQWAGYAPYRAAAYPYVGYPYAAGLYAGGYYPYGYGYGYTAAWGYK